MSTILICDDDQDLINLITEKLISEGYETLVTKNGNDALKMVSQHKPDLVVQDALVPGMHGFDVCRTIKNQPETRHIPVILMTAVYKKPRYKQEVILKYGASDYVLKPFDVKELVEKIKKYV